MPSERFSASSLWSVNSNVTWKSMAIPSRSAPHARLMGSIRSSENARCADEFRHALPSVLRQRCEPRARGAVTMPQRDPAPAGAPCWIELSTSDPERTQPFYNDLFGWTCDAAGDEYGGYFNFA